jgi:hypothetical protein
MKLRSLLMLGGFLALAGAAHAQNYDCRILFSINVSGTSTPVPGFDNRSNGCDFWTLVYQAEGVSALTLTVQSAPGASAPGAWVTFVGTVQSGINPNTSTTGAQTLLVGFNSFIRVNATFTASGTPLINGVLYGYHSGFSPTGGGGCPGTAAIPCAVDGPDAAGAAPTKAPVLTAGQDGAPGAVRVIKTDAAGELIPSNASSADADAISNTQSTATGAGGILYLRVFNKVFNGTSWDRMVGNTTGVPLANASLAGADGVSNTVASPSTVGGVQLYARMFPYIFNGSTNDRQFSCPNQAQISITAGTDVVIVSGVASTFTHICHISFSGSTTVDATIRQGTGSTCGTNTATLVTYSQITQIAMDYHADGAALTTTVQARDTCLHLSASATVNGVAFYATF